LLKYLQVKPLLLLILAASPSLAHLPQSVWTAADFNGDQRPDIARLAVTRPAVLLPVDLDQDADLDLVLRESITDRPVAVWLNDGHGRFTPDAAPRRLPQENRSSWQSAPRPASPLVDVPPSADLVPLLKKSSVRLAQLSLPAHRFPLSRHRKSASARGPPPAYT